MQNEERIRIKFGEASRFTPGVFDAYIVRKFVAGVVALLREVKANPDHELRREFDAAARKLIQDLKTSPEYRDKGRALMQDFILRLANDDYYARLWSDLRRMIEDDLHKQDSVIKEQVAMALASLGNGVLSDRALQAKLNAWLAEAGARHRIATRAPDLLVDLRRREKLECGRCEPQARAGNRPGPAVHPNQRNRCWRLYRHSLAHDRRLRFRLSGERRGREGLSNRTGACPRLIDGPVPRGNPMLLRLSHFGLGGCRVSVG